MSCHAAKGPTAEVQASQLLRRFDLALSEATNELEARKRVVRELENEGVSLMVAYIALHAALCRHTARKVEARAEAVRQDLIAYIKQEEDSTNVESLEQWRGRK